MVAFKLKYEIMKTRLFILLFGILSSIGYGQIREGCSGCTDGNDDIIVNMNGSFSAVTAPAYFWEICEGNATVLGLNTNQTISVLSGGDYTLKLVRFVAGDCFVSCHEVEQNDPPATCPTSYSDMLINEVENCIDYQANVAVYNGDVSHLNWYYRICGVNSGNEVFTGMTTGNSWNMHTVPIYLPPGNNYDNCILIVNAYPVLTDDTICEPISNTLTLSCNGNGGEKVIGTSIFPNPTTNKFTVKSQNASPITIIRVRNLHGRVVKITNKDFSQDIDLSDQVAGMYFVEINFADGSTASKKIILDK